MRILVWFREDLRVEDNTALYEAARRAKNGIIAIYLISPRQWHAHNFSGNRVNFHLKNVQELSKSLAALNISLLIREVENPAKIPDLLNHEMQNNEIDALFFNKQYEIDELRRDQAVEQHLLQHQKQVVMFDDQTIIAPGVLRTQTGKYFTVFTPFKNTWINYLNQQGVPEVQARPRKQASMILTPDAVPSAVRGFETTLTEDLWSVGEKSAKKRLEQFIENKIREYDVKRDFPDLDNTSRISPYLAAGVISPRQCLQAALSANQNKLGAGQKGIVTWINELVWREFYKNIMYCFPRICMYRAFKLNTEKIPWDNNAQWFKAWQQGKTGFPIVDAAMRQLQVEGWMHNRLRMIVAMFLVKDLLIDWRWGEKHFMDHLIDGDLAANNGGWQWAASTGTDSVPYFRIFNPWSQSEKFDADGNFIKRYCPELKNIPARALHDPALLAAALRGKSDYPAPIVDHSEAREKVLKIFKEL